MFVRKDSIKPPGAYLSEPILRVGSIRGEAYSKGGLLNLQVLRAAKHNLYYFLHSQIAFSQRFDSYKVHPECGKGEEASKPITNSERISDILFKKFVEMKNTLKHIELNVIL